MPTYGYRCSNCGHEFEIQQRMSDPPLKACPKCEGKLSKILYPVGISFKGSGFYTTDYKGSSEGAAASSDGAGAASTSGSETKSDSSKSESSKSESKSESKPEKKAASKSDSKTEKKAS